MQLKKIPSTIVTGFLGSGKTTLLSNVLKQAAGKRIAVIVNEFGELDIDANLLRSCPLDCEDENQTPVIGEDGVYELANGCICCTVEEEFLPVMKQLVNRRDDIDYILIETSGLALPKPLVQAFNWPEIKQYCTVDAVITVVDGPAVSAGRYANEPSKVAAQRAADENLDHDPSLKELLDDQLNAADLVVVSKNDRLTDSERKEVESAVTGRVSDAVKTLYIEHGHVPLDLLLGLEAASEKRIESVHSHHDHYHAQGESHSHAHDHFDSRVITLGEVDSDALQMKLSKLLREFNLYRAKGFAALSNKPMRQVFQAVGERLDVYFDRPWAADEPRKTQLVLIGKDLDWPVITAELKGAEISV